jgi:hypothetical protein
MVLLEVLDRDAAAAPNFLCECSVAQSVSSALVHVVTVSRLRAELARYAALCAPAPDEGQGPSAVAQKRAHNAEALLDAAALLSPQAVQKKTVLTVELLEAALAAHQVQPCRIAELQEAPPSPAIELVFAGRSLEQDKKLSDYFGKHEKSKVKVTLSGTPVGTSDDTTDAVPAPLHNGGEQRQDGTPLASSRVQQGASAAPPAPSVSLSSFFRRSQAGGELLDEVVEEEGGGEDDEDAPLLSANQAAKLMESRDICEAIRDPRLQEVLRHVDSAPTREGALRRLELALEDPEFESFSMAALREIGWATAIGNGEPPRPPT